MLASKLLSRKDFEKEPNKVVKTVNLFVKKSSDKYLTILNKLILKPIITIIIFVILILLTVIIYPNIKQEFSPKEDRGAFFLLVNGPEGASYKFMEEYMTEIEKRIMPYVESGEVSRLLVRAPRAFGNIENFNSGIAIVVLNDWSQRRSANIIMDEIRNLVSDLPGVRAFPIMRQGLGGGTKKPVQFVIGGSTYEELAWWRDIIIEKVNENNPGFQGLDSDYKETRPQIDFNILYDRAADLGVTIAEIGRTLETMMGGRNVTTFLDRGEEYDVVIEGERENQSSITDVKNIYIKSNRTNELIPISNLVEVSKYGAAETLSRYNRIRSITLEANLEDGYALGDALEFLDKIVKENLPSEAVTDYKGQSRDFIESGSSILFVFILGLVVVFLVLAAQFESYIHPFVIMLTVPLAMGGGLLGLLITGNSLNIYSQIGLIMLVGLAAKNGILIVEFANQLRDQGVEFSKALIDACKVRFRPIIMTGLTTIAGAVPLVLTSGAGAETRTVIGIVILFGVISTTIFTLFIVPVAYSLIAKNTTSPNYVKRKLDSLNSKAV